MQTQITTTPELGIGYLGDGDWYVYIQPPAVDGELPESTEVALTEHAAPDGDGDQVDIPIPVLLQALRTLALGGYTLPVSARYQRTGDPSHPRWEFLS